MVESLATRPAPAPTVPVHNILRARLSNSRISLPVNRHVMYARFKHVQGVPAGEDGAGLSVSRLRVLDTLIDRLIAVQNRERPQFENLTEEAADKLIRQFEQELRSAVHRLEIGPNRAGYGVGLLQSGQWLSLVA